MKRSYDHYVHTLAVNYLQFGIPYEDTVSSVPAYSEIMGRDALSTVKACLPSLKQRLSSVSKSLSDIILDPSIRTLIVDERSILIPLINEQGVEWYGNSPLSNYDFTIEKALGLLDGAQVIYDFGGHHGVWTAYYAMLSPMTQIIYSFEPSILNVEIATLLMLINNVTNVSFQGRAIGAYPSSKISEQKPVLLVDYVDTQLFMAGLADIGWQKADFIKIDIEGYEYELVKNAEWIFQMTRHMHLELHIPHLQARGLDYREVFTRIPFNQFRVFMPQDGQLQEIGPEMELSGFCSLLLKRKV